MRKIFASLFVTVVGCGYFLFAQGASSPDTLAIIHPVLQVTQTMSAQMPAAQTVDELQKQVHTLLSDEAIQKLYQGANKKLDEVAQVSTLRGPFELSNFDSIIPGVFRSANPTLEQAKGLIESGKINHIVSLNVELRSLAEMDSGTELPLTEARKQVMREKFKQRGKSEERANLEITFYEKHFTYAQAVAKKKLSYHSFFPLDDPKETLSKYFEALEKVIELKKQGKKTLIHCSVGKHRTGLVSMLIKSFEFEDNLSVEQATTQSNALYRKFIERNWNERAESRIHYALPFFLILKSKPYQELRRRWKGK